MPSEELKSRGWVTPLWGLEWLHVAGKSERVAHHREISFFLSFSEPRDNWRMTAMGFWSSASFCLLLGCQSLFSMRLSEVREWLKEESVLAVSHVGSGTRTQAWQSPACSRISLYFIQWCRECTVFSHCRDTSVAVSRVIENLCTHVWTVLKHRYNIGFLLSQWLLSMSL